jgi:hypothetical protein
MAGTDNIAALALQRLVVSDLDGLNALMRTGWSYFIISLWRRTPEALQQIEAGLRESFAENDVDLEMTGDPDTDRDRQAEFQKHLAMALQNLVLSPGVGKRIFDMRWSVVRISNTRHTLLTSDRPFVMTNGIGRPDSHIAIPISPDRCFLAAASVETERRIHSMSPEELFAVLNNRVVRQSRKLVFGVDDSQLRFISNRFGRRERAAPGDDP